MEQYIGSTRIPDLDLKTTNDVYVMATTYSHEIGYVIIAVVVLVIGFLAYKGLKKKKKKK